MAARGGVRKWLERWLRVPPPPEAPAGSPESVRVFRPAPGFYRYRLIQWGVKQVGALWGLVMGLYFVGQIPAFAWDWVMHAAETIGIVTYVVQIPVTFLLVKVDFDYRWYMVTDRSLRIREGVVHLREQTMSFANIQNLAIEQGPLQRLFGISDLKVRTAGGGGKESDTDSKAGSKNLHLGYFRGVDRPQEIRDTMLRRLRRHRDAGLGDPEDVRAPGALEPEPAPPARPLPPRIATATPSLSLAAARELLAEARALRATWG